MNQSDRAIAALQKFLDTPLDKNLQRAVEGDAKSNVLTLFQEVAKGIPAYQQFLQERNIDPASIQAFEDFQTLPLMTKANYAHKYPLPQLCRNGQLESCDMIAASSGSTGKPTFWLRSVSDELAIATRFEQIFSDSFQADSKRTLAVVCFALGTWVGGLYTLNCCRHLAAKGYPITSIAPGSNKTEIFRVIQELAPHFEQVVLLGYPPFLKDAIDSGRVRGIPWQDYGIKLVMAGEVFSEEWRSLVGERLGSSNPCYDSATLYGTADAGVLGNETPLSIAIRRFFSQNPEAARQLFGESRLPTLVQYDPLSRFFETQDGTLLFSGDNGIPLIRYHIADTGGIVPHSAMLEFLRDWGCDPIALLQSYRDRMVDAALRDRGIHPLPFVYVFGRSNFIVSYFGANLYPENITVGLEQPEIREWVTGKFVMEAFEDAQKNRVLSITVELAPNEEPTAERERAIANAVRQQLLRLNSEFANYVPSESQTPRILLKPTGDPEDFPLGVKHRYTRSPQEKRGT
ncbi:phenylacetate--CoA ligase family protein [Lusitaniella coriacea LEGE 07157]|uniref:Phenylacetate--CoA ligase family protein n=1 Tax=Lusitaniella coriacea LEGE 07157 TaxID=945747 RepID=A0A8J7J7K8_9CYAN|nr:phenylacetate--CoA ligase family protein [Lusitaniella coriacea]MBE9115855.1 phenylacetate--CoA ligase family protein [Lusitaniella coriacea LEGE 07157]